MDAKNEEFYGKTVFRHILCRFSLTNADRIVKIHFDIIQ